MAERSQKGWKTQCSLFLTVFSRLVQHTLKQGFVWERVVLHTHPYSLSKQVSIILHIWKWTDDIPPAIIKEGEDRTQFMDIIMSSFSKLGKALAVIDCILHHNCIMMKNFPSPIIFFVPVRIVTQ